MFLSTDQEAYIIITIDIESSLEAFFILNYSLIYPSEMESNLHEDSSKTSSYEEDEEEETDNRRSNDKEMGTGRSYECVFCKRGFTTAQALGGHMNIHRKDRAKPRPNSISSSSKMNDYDHDYNHYANIRGISSYPYHHHHYSSTVHHHHHRHEMLINYQTFIPAASASTSKNTRWGFRSPHAQYSDDLYVQTPQLLNHFQADWRSNLSLQIGPSHMDLEDDDDDNKEKTEDDQLDLELRLGHDPR